MKAKQRKSGRQPLSYPAKIIADDRSCNCRLVDVSDGGALLVTDEPLELPQEFMLALSGSITRRCQLRWSEDCDVGVLFVR